MPPCLFLVDGGRLLVRVHSIQRINSDINTRTGKVLASIDEPLENRDDNDNRECSNSVVWRVD